MILEPVVIPFFENIKVKNVQGGSAHSVVITEDNVVYSFGSNWNNELGRAGSGC